MHLRLATVRSPAFRVSHSQTGSSPHGGCSSRAGTAVAIEDPRVPNVKTHLHTISTSDVTGSMSRDVPITVANISRGGCLLEAAVALPLGTIGILHVELHGMVYSDPVRVTRSPIIPAAGVRHLIGVEFVELDTPGPQALRRYAATLRTPRGLHCNAALGIGDE